MMATPPTYSQLFADLAAKPPTPTLDVINATVEIVSFYDDICVLRGVVPPGSVVPMHRHDDFEDFFILSGRQQVLVSDGESLAWRECVAGDYLRIPGHAVHAHRNVSDEPAVDMIITTARLGRFFEEVGRPATEPLTPPTDAELAHFLAKSAEYGYVLSTPEENARYGIDLPAVTA